MRRDGRTADPRRSATLTGDRDRSPRSAPSVDPLATKALRRGKCSEMPMVLRSRKSIGPRQAGEVELRDPAPATPRRRSTRPRGRTAYEVGISLLLSFSASSSSAAERKKKKQKNFAVGHVAGSPASRAATLAGSPERNTQGRILQRAACLKLSCIYCGYRFNQGNICLAG